jgi:glucose-6-phosphate isomerase
MRFLTTEAALKDVEVFANQFEWKDHVMNPKKIPWVLVGGSYAGQRAARNANNHFGYCEGPVYNASATPDCQIDAIFDGDFGINWTWQ